MNPCRIHRVAFTVASTLFLMLASSPVLWAQDSEEPSEKHPDLVWRATKGHSLIRDINQKPDKYINEKVEIVATNQGPVEGDRQYTLYVMQDMFAGGNSIQLRVNEGEVAPPLGQRVVLQAMVNKMGAAPILTKPTLVPIGGGGGSGTPVVSNAADYRIWILLGAAAVLLIVVAFLIVFMLRSGQRAAVAGPALPVAAPSPIGQSPLSMPSLAPTGMGGPIDMAPTMKRPAPSTMLSTTRESTVVAPTDKTMKLLPGSFDVLTGTAKGQRIFIYSAETTIGRGHSDGPGPHIGFDPDERSISRRQAKLVYDNVAKKFRLINLADPGSVNATVVNGREMGLNEMNDLNDGDTIRFGEIELQFRATDRAGSPAGRAEVARA